MAIVYKNKEYRNLQEQVLENARNIAILQEKPGLQPVIVDELPETGEVGILYLVPSEDPETENAYDEYVWVEEEEAFEMVGSTAIDLSGLVTLDTEQTITGTKSFTADVNLQSDINVGGDVVVDGLVVIGATGYDIKKDGSNLVIEADGNSIKIRGGLIPNSGDTYGLGTTGAFWNYINVNSVNFGNNATISKDSSNRINLNNGGNVRIKVGGVDSTYCVANWTPDIDGTYSLGKDNMRWTDVNTSTVSNDYSNLTLKGNPGITVQLAAGGTITPSQNNSYKIGSESSRFNTVFTTTISNATKYVNVADIVTKPDYANPDVFESGTLNASGQGTIDMTETGMPEDGLYMFTYGNCQCFLSLTSTMIQNANTYPIRCTCPMMFNGSAYPGILKIERAADLLTLTVATAGVGNVTPSGFEWKLIKVL